MTNKPATKKTSRSAKTVQPKASTKQTTSRNKANHNSRKSVKLGWFKRFFRWVRVRTSQFLRRRPHRSFRLTRRRDYIRPLRLPGYWAFTRAVNRLLLQHKWTFIWLVIIYALLSGTMVGLASQSTFNALNSTIGQTGGDLFKGNWGALSRAGLLAVSSVMGGLSQSLSSAQQIYAGLFVLLLWLTTVWLVRNFVAHRSVRLRDGLYNAGAPLISTLLVALLILVQLIPVVLAMIGFGAASATGLLDNGVEAMLFWIGAGLLAVLSLYWITSTLIALVIVTLPGMYPWQAIVTAGDLVVGRRLRILYRWLWMMLVVLLAWAAILIPLILLDTWLNSLWAAFGSVPIIPIALLLMSAITVVWVSSYVYLLYRKVVDDDTAPAL